MNTNLSRRRALELMGAGALFPFRSFVSDEPIHFLGLQEISTRVRSRAISAVDLTQHMLNRIATVDPNLKSYALVMTEQALAGARAADEEIRRGRYRGPLHGVPIAVKDLCYTKGVHTMGGTAVLRDFVPSYDATVVAKLRNAGAVLLGKLNLTEGALVGYHPDLDVPRNPWDTRRWPGASSSGSGVAAAAGLCFAAIGTDTGGSIRFPSSANGIVGLKPTYGRVSRHGVLALAESMDHVGPIARRVADVALMFDAIAGHDASDTTSLRGTPQRTVSALTQGIKGLRIGIDRMYAFDKQDRGETAAIEEALKVLTSLGATIVDVKMPDLTGMVETWMPICVSELAAAHRAHYPARASEYGPYMREMLQMGAAVTGEQLAAARKARADFSARFTAVLESVDAMACPAGGSPAWPITREIQTGGAAVFHAAWGAAAPRAADFTMPMNLAGTPSICLPSGFSSENIPYSIQFAGRRLSESTLCRIAYAYEQATPWHERHPKSEG